MLHVDAANKLVLRSILENSDPPHANTSEERSIFYMLITNYNSCMNNNTIEESGFGQLPQLLQNISSIFHIEEGDYLSNTTMKERDYDAFAQAIVFMTKHGIPLFGEFWTTPDYQNPDTVIPRFGPNFYELKENALPAQGRISDLAALDEEEITGILQSILQSITAKSHASEIAKRLKKFMISFQAIEQPAISDLQFFSAPYYTTSITNATHTAPSLVLDRVISALAPSNFTSDQMVFQYPEMYAKIDKLVEDTPRSTLQVLMSFMVYNSLAPYITGSSATVSDRFEFCYDYIDTSLPWIASKFFVGQAYSDKTRDFTKTLADDLKQAFHDRVNELTWIADETRPLIQEKLSDMLPNIGYPDHSPAVQDAKYLLTYYSPINISISLSSNVLSIRQWAVSKAWNHLSSSTDPSIWPEQGAHAYNTGARYNFINNQFILPAGLPQQPVYFPGAPSYLTYSSLGLVAGHEITHGFDTNGRRWNQDRQYRDWWDKESVAAFENKTNCFVEQYSGMEAVDSFGKPFLNGTSNSTFYVNGRQTLAENIADAGGIGTAFSAWKKHEEKECSPRLPGLEKFTKEQLFFVGAGQVWCSKFNADAMEKYVREDIHAPPFARIQGLTQNSRAFREAWQCKKKEPVCGLW
ncbi:hypothetical protein N0V90_003816 [Kalmusia sp. IMI 367209]|nr:hypothetical protein N0V90_003816 [Kalmusia sp. IMI 367209]